MNEESEITMKDILNILDDPEQYEWHEDEEFNRLWKTSWRIRSAKNRNFTHFFGQVDKSLLSLDNQRQRHRVLKQQKGLGKVKSRKGAAWHRPSKRSLNTVYPTTKALMEKRAWDNTLLAGLGIENKILVNSRGRFYLKTQYMHKYADKE